MSSYFNETLTAFGNTTVGSGLYDIGNYTGVVGLGQAAAQGFPHLTKFIGSASGVYTAYSGARRIYDNLGAGGTWTGIGHGALEITGGLAGIASVGATGGARFAYTAVNAGVSAFSAFHDAQTTDPAATRTRTMTRLAQGGTNTLRVPALTVAAATGDSGVGTIANTMGHMGTAVSAVHHTVSHGPTAQRMLTAAWHARHPPPPPHEHQD